MTVLLVWWSESVKSLPHPSWHHVVVPPSLTVSGASTCNDMVDVPLLLVLRQTCHYTHQIRATGKNLFAVEIFF